MDSNTERNISFEENDGKKHKGSESLIMDRDETDKLLQKSLVSDGLINAIKETFLSVDFVGQFCQAIVVSESFMHGISEVIHQRVDMQVKDVKEQLKVANERIVKLTNKLNDIEQYSKRRDLIITGIPMKQREDTTSIITDLAKSLGVKIDVKDIYATHRLPVRRIDSTQPIISPIRRDRVGKGGG
ncbi:unnamed protein product, partial [Didymodactylos carnosus]